MVERWPAGIVCLLLLASATAHASSVAPAVERLAERGPATFVVGASFLAVGLIAWPASTLAGDDTSLPACRLAHGAKMALAGLVTLPVGLLAAPFHPAGAATGFADSLADGFQEDVCSRPAWVIYP